MLLVASKVNCDPDPPQQLSAFRFTDHKEPLPYVNDVIVWNTLAHDAMATERLTEHARLQKDINLNFACFVS